jgi:CrcB protein
MTALLVVAGAVIGAPLRYLTDLLVQSRHDTVFPWGTLTVNAAGSLILGLVAGAVSGGAPAWLATLAGTGFCGALTTFSTFGFETLRLVEEGSLLEAVLNTAVSLLIGFVACAGGWVLAAGLA